MKAKLLFLFTLCTIATLVFAVKILVIDRQAVQMGMLQIQTVPESSVFVNAEARGRTPFTQSLAPGEYQIKLIPLSEDPEASASAVTWQGKVVLQSRQLTYVRRELANTEVESTGEMLTVRKSDVPSAAGTGDIEVQTQPQGAIVTLDGREVGVSPHIIRSVEVGPHEISVYLPKFKRRTIQVNVVKGGYTTIATFALGLDVDFEKKFEIAKAFESTDSAKFPTLPTAAPTATPKPVPKKILILETSVGFLRVRDDSNLAGREVAKVKPGETYDFLEERPGWVKLKLDSEKSGWVSEEYVKKVFEGESSATQTPTPSVQPTQAG